MFLQPVQYAFKELVNVAVFHRLMDARLKKPEDQPDQELMSEIEQKATNLLREAKRLSGEREGGEKVAQEIKHKLEAILYLPIVTSRYPRFQPIGVKAAAEYLNKQLTDSIFIWATLFSWLFVHALGKTGNSRDFAGQSRIWIDEWGLGNTIFSVLKDLGLDEAAAWNSLMVIKFLTAYQRWFEMKESGQKQAYAILESLLKDKEVRQFLQVNQYNNIWWFNKESFEEMLWWLMLTAAVEISSDPLRSLNAVVEGLNRCYSLIQAWQKAKEKSEYQVEKLLSIVKSSAISQ
jgi:hypothetical protein